MTQTNKPYRRGAGAVLFNANNLVLMAERLDTPGAMQFPQGGLDTDEDPYTGVLRELREEIGTDNVELIKEAPDWLSYDFPPELKHHPVYKNHRGQIQKWFAFRFLGRDADIRLDAHDDIEFTRYEWVPLEKAPDLIVPFKRNLYQQIVLLFQGL